MSTNDIKLLDAEPTLRDEFGNLTIRKDQEITDDFLTDQRDARFNSAARREGEFMEICALPTIVVEQWKRQGFDIYAPGVRAKDIVARLQRDNLTAFLSTNKRV